MKLKDIINNLDKSESNECRSIQWNLETLVQECNLSSWSVQQEDDNIRLRSYWVSNHYCTDTYVGYRAYFLDDVFVCLSYQSARKSDETFEWVSKEALENVRSFIISLQEEDELSLPKEYLDMEEEFGEGYPIQYTGQMLRREVLYKGKLVDVVEDDGKGYTNLHNIVIKEKDTDSLVDIDVRDILVPWYTIKEGE